LADEPVTLDVLASRVEDEYRALKGGHERRVALDDRGMFPGTLAP